MDVNRPQEWAERFFVPPSIIDSLALALLSPLSLMAYWLGIQPAIPKPIRFKCATWVWVKHQVDPYQKEV